MLKKITFWALVLFGAIVVVILFGSLVDKISNANNFAPPTFSSSTASSTTQQSSGVSSNASTATGGIAMTEVTKHNTAGDCYLVISNKVYDVTSYISSGAHPTGNSQIISSCGQEVTSIFAKVHSNRAWDLLTTYKVGALSQ